MISSDNKQKLIKDSQRKKEDTGSPEVQVTIMTARINEITEHLKNNKHDFMARRGLLQLVGKRKKLLKYLAEKDPKSYLEIIEKLGIRRAF
ncbi:30S ribosomal protein S15 [Candidatus Nomurabacteria bacterium]|nr:30S ribosomal protein S15 [Candidatus Nomurabacteria bacterium]